MSEFAYTFTYTPTLTTRRAPVYVALLRASALIILWSQVQVLVGPPDRHTLISNGGGFVYLALLWPFTTYLLGYLTLYASCV
jgi:hypothetical protein